MTNVRRLPLHVQALYCSIDSVDSSVDALSVIACRLEAELSSRSVMSFNLVLSAHGLHGHVGDGASRPVSISYFRFVCLETRRRSPRPDLPMWWFWACCRSTPYADVTLSILDPARYFDHHLPCASCGELLSPDDGVVCRREPCMWTCCESCWPDIPVPYYPRAIRRRAQVHSHPPTPVSPATTTNPMYPPPLHGLPDHNTSEWFACSPGQSIPAALRHRGCPYVFAIFEVIRDASFVVHPSSLCPLPLPPWCPDKWRQVASPIISVPTGIRTTSAAPASADDAAASAPAAPPPAPAPEVLPAPAHEGGGVGGAPGKQRGPHSVLGDETSSGERSPSERSGKRDPCVRPSGTDPSTPPPRRPSGGASSRDDAADGGHHRQSRSTRGGDPTPSPSYRPGVSRVRGGKGSGLRPRTLDLSESEGGEVPLPDASVTGAKLEPEDLLFPASLFEPGNWHHCVLAPDALEVLDVLDPSVVLLRAVGAVKDGRYSTVPPARPETHPLLANALQLRPSVPASPDHLHERFVTGLQIALARVSAHHGVWMLPMLPSHGAPADGKDGLAALRPSLRAEHRGIREFVSPWWWACLMAAATVCRTASAAGSRSRALLMPVHISPVHWAYIVVFVGPDRVVDAITLDSWPDERGRQAAALDALAKTFLDHLHCVSSPLGVTGCDIPRGDQQCRLLQVLPPENGINGCGLLPLLQALLIACDIVANTASAASGTATGKQQAPDAVDAESSHASSRSEGFSQRGDELALDPHPHTLQHPPSEEQWRRNALQAILSANREAAAGVADACPERLRPPPAADDLPDPEPSGADAPAAPRLQSYVSALPLSREALAIQASSKPESPMSTPPTGGLVKIVEVASWWRGGPKDPAWLKEPPSAGKGLIAHKDIIPRQEHRSSFLGGIPLASFSKDPSTNYKEPFWIHPRDAHSERFDTAIRLRGSFRPPVGAVAGSIAAVMGGLAGFACDGIWRDTAVFRQARRLKNVFVVAVRKIASGAPILCSYHFDYWQCRRTIRPGRNHLVTCWPPRITPVREWAISSGYFARDSVPTDMQLSVLVPTWLREEVFNPPGVANPPPPPPPGGRGPRSAGGNGNAGAGSSSSKPPGAGAVAPSALPPAGGGGRGSGGRTAGGGGRGGGGGDGAGGGSTRRRGGAAGAAVAAAGVGGGGGGRGTGPQQQQQGAPTAPARRAASAAAAAPRAAAAAARADSSIRLGGTSPSPPPPPSSSGSSASRSSSARAGSRPAPACSHPPMHIYELPPWLAAGGGRDCPSTPLEATPSLAMVAGVVQASTEKAHDVDDGASLIWSTVPVLGKSGKKNALGIRTCPMVFGIPRDAGDLVVRAYCGTAEAGRAALEKLRGISLRTCIFRGFTEMLHLHLALADGVSVVTSRVPAGHAAIIDSNVFSFVACPIGPFVRGPCRHVTSFCRVEELPTTPEPAEHLRVTAQVKELTDKLVTNAEELKAAKEREASADRRRSVAEGNLVTKDKELKAANARAASAERRLASAAPNLEKVKQDLTRIQHGLEMIAAANVVFPQQAQHLIALTKGARDLI